MSETLGIARTLPSSGDLVAAQEQWNPLVEVEPEPASSGSHLLTRTA